MRLRLLTLLLLGLLALPAGCSDDDDGDACANVDCGAFGTCAPAAGTCACDPGYQGAVCDLAEAADFEDLGLASSSHYIGDATGVQSWESGEATFLLYYDDTYGDYWEGIAATNETDTTTGTYLNQYSAIAGGGEGGSTSYGVAYTAGFTIGAELRFPEAGTGLPVAGLYVTNTTYAYFAMRDGDDFAKQFGGPDGTDPDYFLLTIEGIGQDGSATGSVEFYLADYRAADSAEDYLVADWTWVDLTALGDVVGLRFALESTDVGDYGMNTPGYFAFDSVLLLTGP